MTIRKAGVPSNISGNPVILISPAEREELRRKAQEIREAQVNTLRAMLEMIEDIKYCGAAGVMAGCVLELTGYPQKEAFRLENLRKLDASNRKVCLDFIASHSHGLEKMLDVEVVKELKYVVRHSA